MTATKAQQATLALLASRAPTATVCPSEVARSLASTAGPEAGAVSWRDLMPVVHSAVDRLVIDGHVRLSWKGQALPTRSGPYRIGRA
jgi:hypothetical protein